MTTPYSIFKRLIPRNIRTFVRDLDSAYHKLERDIDSQKQYIQKLEFSYNELQSSYQQLQSSYQELKDASSAYHKLERDIDSQKQYIQKLEFSYNELESSYQQSKSSYQELKDASTINLDLQLQYYFQNIQKSLSLQSKDKIEINIDDYESLSNILPNTGAIPLEQKFSSAKEIVEKYLYATERSQKLEGFEGFAPDDAIFDPETQSYELWSNVALAGIIASYGYANFPDPSILELGCGPAHLLFFFKRYGINNYIGIDGHPSFIEFNPYLSNEKNKFLILNLQEEINLCVNEESLKFDIILSFEVLEHIGENMINNFIQTMKNHMHSKSVVLCTASLQIFDVHVLVRERNWWLDKFSQFGLSPIKDELYICKLLGRNHPFNWSPDNTNVFALEMADK
jgi:2-polyprenyl-3-methyl-5-hydroxy-6-metoxy-1,4-benzoquinol methylase